MGGGRSYEFYDVLSFSLPLSFMILGLVTIYILLPIILPVCYCFSKCNTIFSLQFQILRVVYGDSLMRIEKENKKELEFTLYGRRLHFLTLGSLFTALVLVYFCVMVAFFSELFVTESTGVCNIHMDCFALNTSTGALVQQEALQDNCRDIQDDPSYLIRCYKLSFNYVTALGNAGGVLVFGYFMMTYQTPFLEEAVHTGASKKSCMFFFFAINNAVILLIVAVVLGLILGLVPEFRASAFATKKNILQFSAYAVTFYFCLGTTYFIMFVLWICSITNVCGDEAAAEKKVKKNAAAEKKVKKNGENVEMKEEPRV